MFSVYYFFTRVMQCEYAIVITLYVLKSAFAPEACTVDMYSQLDNFHPEFNGTTDDALTLNTEYNTV